MSTRTGVLSDESVKQICRQHIPMNRIDVLLPMVPNVSGIYSHKTLMKPLPRPANLHAMTSSLKRSTGVDYTQLIKNKLATKFETKAMNPYFDREPIGQQTYGPRRTQNTIVTDTYNELFEGLRLEFESEEPSRVPSRATTADTPDPPTPTPSEAELEREFRYDFNRALQAGLFEFEEGEQPVIPFRRTPPATAQRPIPTRERRPVATLADIQEPQPPAQLQPPTIESLGRGIILSEGSMSRGQPTRQTARV